MISLRLDPLQLHFAMPLLIMVMASQTEHKVSATVDKV